MEHIDYSVVIRTTGKAQEKYQALLDSIDKLEPRPAEIIVVLPEGYDEPEEKLGRETYHYCPKGMVIQRMTGLKMCKSRYALVCDDDVCFGPDFVRQLWEPLRNGLGGFSTGPLYSFLPAVGLNALIDTVMENTAPTIFHRDRYVSVLKSTGYSYNRHLDLKNTTYYETQSVAWTCFFADTDAVRAIDFDDEIWLDSHGYSALDDQTMFYKAWLRGIKTIVVSTAYYEHLDGKTSTQNNKPHVLYSSAYNRVVFWKRFIYDMCKDPFSKTCARIAFAYRMNWLFLWNTINVLRHRMTKEDRKISKQGYRDAMSFVKSEEYKNLPPVIKE